MFIVNFLRGIERNELVFIFPTCCRDSTYLLFYSCFQFDYIMR